MQCILKWTLNGIKRTPFDAETSTNVQAKRRKPQANQTHKRTAILNWKILGIMDDKKTKKWLMKMFASMKSIGILCISMRKIENRSCRFTLIQFYLGLWLTLRDLLVKHPIIAYRKNMLWTANKFSAVHNVQGLCISYRMQQHEKLLINLMSNVRFVLFMRFDITAGLIFCQTDGFVAVAVALTFSFHNSLLTIQ